MVRPTLSDITDALENIGKCPLPPWWRKLIEMVEPVYHRMEVQATAKTLSRFRSCPHERLAIAWARAGPMPTHEYVGKLTRFAKERLQANFVWSGSGLPVVVITGESFNGVQEHDLGGQKAVFVPFRSIPCFNYRSRLTRKEHLIFSRCEQCHKLTQVNEFCDLYSDSAYSNVFCSAECRADAGGDDVPEEMERVLEVVEIWSKRKGWPWMSVIAGDKLLPAHVCGVLALTRMDLTSIYEGLTREQADLVDRRATLFQRAVTTHEKLGMTAMMAAMEYPPAPFEHSCQRSKLGIKAAPSHAEK